MMTMELDPSLVDLPRFGNYVLLGKLGTGGMADVYLAVELAEHGLQRQIALKRIKADLLQDEEFLISFLDEARLCVNLDHRNIVSTLRLGTHDGQHYLVMQYVEGVSLSQFIFHFRKRSQQLPLYVVLDIVRELCEGLSYAHAATTAVGRPLAIVHRDLKPGNILLSLRGDVKITDFGIAKAATNRHVTEDFQTKGTVAYMSPEQAAGEEIDLRSDLYSLGSIFYELLTLDRLYPNASGLPGINQVINGDVSRRLERLTALPSSLLPIITRLLEKEPSARYRNAAELKRDLMVARSSMMLEPVDLGEMVRMVRDERSLPLVTKPEASSGASVDATLNPAGKGAGPGYLPVGSRGEEEDRPSSRSTLPTDRTLGPRERAAAPGARDLETATSAGGRTGIPATSRPPSTGADTGEPRSAVSPSAAGARAGESAPPALRAGKRPLPLVLAAAVTATAVIGLLLWSPWRSAEPPPIARNASPAPSISSKPPSPPAGQPGTSPSQVATTQPLPDTSVAAQPNPDSSSMAAGAPDPGKAHSSIAAGAPDPVKAPAPAGEAPRAGSAPQNSPHLHDAPKQGRHAAEVVAKPPAGQSQPARETGSLTIDSRPWSTVMLDQRALGDTPLIGIKVASGRHVLRLTTEDGRTKSIKLEIEPNTELKLGTIDIQ